GWGLGPPGSGPPARVCGAGVAFAGAGLPVDWYVSLKILAVAEDLRRYPESRRVWLRDDLPPIHLSGAPVPRVKLAGLADTLRRLPPPPPPPGYSAAPPPPPRPAPRPPRPPA